MWLNEWRRLFWFRWVRVAARRAPSVRGVRCRLSLEPLEDRWLPSSLVDVADIPSGSQVSGPVSLVDSGGTLYGEDSNGNVFSVQSTNVHFIANTGEGSYPTLVSSDGSIYSLASSATNGDSIVQVSAGGVSTVASFGDAGLGSAMSLISDGDGNLYGTAFDPNTDGLMIFEESGGTITSVVDPLVEVADATLFAYSDGNLYGLSGAPVGIATYSGTVFEVAVATGDVTTVGDLTATSLIADSQGNIDGVTPSGQIFQLAGGAGSPQTLGTIPDPGMANTILSLTSVDSAGDIYGFAQNGGTGSGSIFELVKNSQTTIDLARFGNGSTANGLGPTALVSDGHGDFFGTTASGKNSASQNGTIFELQDVTATDTLAVSVQPPDEVMPGPGFTFSVTVTDKNSKGQPVANLPLTLAIGNDPSGSATLGGGTPPTATTNSQGQATFTGLSLDNLGNGYTLQASAGGTEPVTVTTNAFDVVPQITLTWTGKDSADWSNPENWTNDNGNPQVPSGQGENLVFPTGLARLSTVNDVSTLQDLQVNTIEVDGNYLFAGNAIDVIQGITVDGGSPDFGTVVLGQGVAGAAVPAAAGSAASPLADGGPVLWNVIAGDSKATNLEGGAGLKKTGPGELDVTRTSSFTGSVELDAGTLKLIQADADPLGTGTFIVNPIDPSTPVTLALAQAMTLPDTVSLQGGTLNVTGADLTLKGAVTVAANTVIDTDHPVEVTITGTLTSVGGFSTLDVGAASEVVLNGAMNGYVTAQIGASVDFGPQLSGTGFVLVQGTLTSDTANSFAGTIDQVLPNAAITVGANNALGTNSSVDLNGGSLRGGRGDAAERHQLICHGRR